MSNPISSVSSVFNSLVNGTAQTLTVLPELGKWGAKAVKASQANWEANAENRKQIARMESEEDVLKAKVKFSKAYENYENNMSKEANDYLKNKGIITE